MKKEVTQYGCILRPHCITADWITVNLGHIGNGRAFIENFVINFVNATSQEVSIAADLYAIDVTTELALLRGTYDEKLAEKYEFTYFEIEKPQEGVPLVNRGCSRGF